MQRQIDYYFSLLSPWTYLGHELFLSIAARHGCTINYLPVPLRSVFDETGGLPLPKRHPVRQRYRILELQRWRERRGRALNLFPRHFPLDIALADRALIAATLAGKDPGAFMERVLAGVWAQEFDLSQRGLVIEMADASGLDGKALVDQAESEAVAARYAASSEAAVKAGVFGAPSYVLGGEVFWGQDRLELLDDALASGRAPYSTEAKA